MSLGLDRAASKIASDAATELRAIAVSAAANVKRLTLVACILGSGISLLDGSIVNIALPTIQRDLGGGLAAQQWVSNAYLLTLGSLILLGGSLGDLYGERRIFTLGVGGFGAASVLCAVAPTIGFLVAFRALQGVAGALLLPSSLAVIVATFPEAERGRAIGVWTAFGAIATVIGPLAGGELLALAVWRWLFVINVPFVVTCIVLIQTVVPRPSRGKTAQRTLDFAGAGLCVIGLGATVFALIEAPRLGWSSPAVLGSLSTGVAVLAAFVIWERRARDPMLPLGLFARRNFAIANIETFLIYAGLAIALFFLVLFLQQVAGYSPLHSGLATLPVTILLFTLSQRFGALAGRLGPRLFMSLGPLIAAAGLFLLLRLSVHPSYAGDVLPAVVVFGLGLAMTVAPLTATVLAGVEPDRAGIASAVNNATARIAGLLGTTSVGAVIAARFAAQFSAGVNGLRLGAAARSAAVAAKHLVLGHPDVAAVPAAQAHAITRAADAASLSSFHTAIAIAAGLVLLGAIAGAIGIENTAKQRLNAGA
jgi:EmrB/QacA subfamily drug resistance transporter